MNQPPAVLTRTPFPPHPVLKENYSTMAKTVADIMSRDPVTVRPETPLKVAIQILAERKFSGLPVVDDNNRVIGVISETDLMWQETGVTPPAYVKLLDMVIYLENPTQYDRDLHKALGQTVGDVMTYNAVTITADKTSREAAKLMHDRKIHRLPVLNDAGDLIGILTRGDIVQAMATESD